MGPTASAEVYDFFLRRGDAVPQGYAGDHLGLLTPQAPTQWYGHQGDILRYVFFGGFD